MNAEVNKEQSGAALVEAALVMLTFLVIIFSIFEAGRMLQIQQTLTNAAREGARLSVLPLQGGTDTLPSTTTVENRVRQFLNASGLNGAAATIAVNQACCTPTTSGCLTCATGDQVYSRVQITVPYRILSISMFGLLQVNLHGRAAMRNETNFQ